MIGLVGVVTKGDPLLIVLQYCDKGSLLSVLRSETTIPADRLRGYALGIARGMEHLTRHHAIHRDLAARNVLVDAMDSAKVSDFGLSRTIDANVQSYRNFLKQNHQINSNSDYLRLAWRGDTLRDWKTKAIAFSFSIRFPERLRQPFDYGEQ